VAILSLSACAETLSADVLSPRSHSSPRKAVSDQQHTELLVAPLGRSQSRTRNRCNGEGYESVALIPLHVGKSDWTPPIERPAKRAFSAEVIALGRGWQDTWLRLCPSSAPMKPCNRARPSSERWPKEFRSWPGCKCRSWIFWYNQRWYQYTGTPRIRWKAGLQSVHDPVALPKVMERWTASIATAEPFDMVFPLREPTENFAPS